MARHHVVDPPRHGTVDAFEVFHGHHRVDVALFVLLRHAADFRGEPAEMIDAVVETVPDGFEIAVVALGNLGGHDPFADVIHVLRDDPKRAYQRVHDLVHRGQHFAAAPPAADIGTFVQTAILDRLRNAL